MYFFRIFSLDSKLAGTVHVTKNYLSKMPRHILNTLNYDLSSDSGGYWTPPRKLTKRHHLTYAMRIALHCR